MMDLSMTTLLERAETWLAHDPEAGTRAELGALIERTKAGDAAASQDLAERFVGPLEFGTAGLRGVIGAGESRMNVAVILRTTFGLGTYLLNDPEANVKVRGIAIGYDGRRFSREFAEAAVGVLAAMGIPSQLSQGVCPTPVLAYAVTRLGSAAGIMVTASHNPPEYNGYKVYWGNGAQIIPPHDKGIAAEVDRAPHADQVPNVGFEQARKSGLLQDFPLDLEPAYLDAVQALSIKSGGARDAAIVYTALHGVGDRLVRETMKRAGFSNVHSVAQQAEPDGEFPTVAFPNPEEKGALDLSYALAEQVGADLILASDPDVDRLAAAVRKANGDKPFTQLTGNQVGVLLGHYLLTEGPQGDNRTALASCVSSPQLGAIARALGVHYEETLTGFKWIANRAMELERTAGKSFVFGYEEALGYTVGPLVRDKDGISAALLFAELWAGLRANGKTVFDELERIARAYGCFVSSQLSVTMKGADGLKKIQEVMAHLRSTSASAFGPAEVLALSDVKAGTKRAADGSESKLVLPPSDVLIYDLVGGSRIIARPSGTEPKLKIYFDVRETVIGSEAMSAAEARATERMTAIAAAFKTHAGL
jgi:phosphomannomutase